VSDVRHARREIQEVIRALDQEIMETFSSAVADVNEHFSALIAMLFPGGQGRLILTEPTTRSTPASRSRCGRWAETSDVSHCCPAVNDRWRRWPSSSRCSVRGRRRST